MMRLSAAMFNRNQYRLIDGDIAETFLPEVPKAVDAKGGYRDLP